MLRMFVWFASNTSAKVEWWHTVSANCRSAQCSRPGCGLGVQKLVLDELWCQQETNQRRETRRLFQKCCHPGPGQTTLSGAASDTRVGRPDAHTHTHAQTVGAAQNDVLRNFSKKTLELTTLTYIDFYSFSQPNPHPNLILSKPNPDFNLTSILSYLWS